MDGTAKNNIQAIIAIIVNELRPGLGAGMDCESFALAVNGFLSPSRILGAAQPFPPDAMGALRLKAGP